MARLALWLKVVGEQNWSGCYIIGGFKGFIRDDEHFAKW
jgi:hypothetical protein